MRLFCRSPERFAGDFAMKLPTGILLISLIFLAACSRKPVILGDTCDIVPVGSAMMTSAVVGRKCNVKKKFCLNVIKLKSGGTRNQIRTIGARTIVRVFRPAVVEMVIDNQSSFFLVNKRAAFENKNSKARCKAR